MPVAFLPPVGPSPGTEITADVSLVKTAFGDGYGQASPRGLRHIRKRVTLRWDALTLDQAREIEAFMVARNGCEPFSYRLRGEATDRTWTCESWQRVDGAPATFRAELVEHHGI